MILENKKILITAGPTQEHIDPVRFISNKSSGKMGFAIASAAIYYGGDVTLISGPVNLNSIPGVKQIDVENAHDMSLAIKNEINKNKFDVIIMAAAVADYSPDKIADQKIKSNKNTLELTLDKNIDILKSISNYQALKIGFALETSNGEKNAIKKMQDKGLDYILLNYANEKNAGFEGDLNHLYLFSKTGYKKEFETDTKIRLARTILKTIFQNGKK